MSFKFTLYFDFLVKNFKTNLLLKASIKSTFKSVKVFLILLKQAIKKSKKQILSSFSQYIYTTSNVYLMWNKTMVSLLCKFLQVCCSNGSHFMSVLKIVYRSLSSHVNVIYINVLVFPAGVNLKYYLIILLLAIIYCSICLFCSSVLQQ